MVGYLSKQQLLRRNFCLIPGYFFPDVLSSHQASPRHILTPFGAFFSIPLAIIVGTYTPITTLISHIGTLFTTLNVSVNGLVLHGVEVLLLHFLIQLQGLVLLALALQNLTSLDKEGG